jgi:hypothetical protein
MERLARAHVAWLAVALSLVACAEGTVDGEGPPVEDASTERDVAVDDIAVDAPMKAPDVSLDPVDASTLPDASALVDAPAPLDVPITPDVPASVDVPVAMDTPTTVDVPPMFDVPVVPDVPVGADRVVPADTPITDVPADMSGCPSGSSSCMGTCVDHRATALTCATGEALGSYCGDTSCGTLCPSTRFVVVGTRTGRASMWFRARAVECSLCPASLATRITLLVPPGIDYDLFVHRPCGTVVRSSLALAGQTDTINLTQSDTPTTNESFDYVIEVRYVSGSSCQPWTLTLEARSNNGSSC